MADYIFTQNGDNNVQIGDMTGMPHHVNIAFKWALEHNYQSVAAQYSKTLALEVVRLREDNERLCAALQSSKKRAADYEQTGLTPDEIAALRAENEQYRADIDAGRLVRFPVVPGQIVYVRRGCLTWGTFPGDSPWTPCEVITCKKTRSRTEFSLRPMEKRIMAGRVRYHRWASAGAIGFTVFLTEEAARAALGEGTK